jgi:uncharacterized repeat protein (TIGR03803 family)
VARRCGADGNLYNTTAYGGVNGSGAMFKMTPGGTLTVQYSFDSTSGMPESGLTLSTDEDLASVDSSDRLWMELRVVFLSCSICHQVGMHHGYAGPAEN